MRKSGEPKNPTRNFGDPKGRRYKETGHCSICPESSFYKVLISGRGYVEFCKRHKQEATELSAKVTRKLNVFDN